MPPARAPRDPRRRLLWRRLMLLGGVALLFASAVLAYLRFGEPAGQEELLWYFHERFPELHGQTTSIQSAIAGLVDDDPPAPELAVGIIDDNILPSIDHLIEQIEVVELEDLDARILHSGYAQAVRQLREDVAGIREVFALPGVAPEEKRNRVRARLGEVSGRFDAFYARSREVLREHEIELR